MTRLVQAAGVVTALRLEAGLIGVSLAIFGTNLLDYMIKAVAGAGKLLPTLRISPRLGDLGSLKEFLSFDGLVFGLQLWEIACSNTQTSC